MPNDEKQDGANNAASSKWSLFAVPPALKRIFDKFPLTTYPRDAFPVCNNRPEDQHILHVFTTRDGARRGLPSYNPSCLKWQTYMKINDIPFVTTTSNNHASPSGALPFVIPKQGQAAVAAKALRRWIVKEAAAQGAAQEPEDVRYEAYSALLESRIRTAWLYQLYLLSANTSVMRRLYIEPCTSNPFVQLSIQHQLRQAAGAELKKATLRTVYDSDLLREAGEALSALSTLLSDKTWFFEDRPSLFDASVFAYTHLLLDEELMQWKDNPLGAILQKHDNLREHRDRMLELYY